MINYSIYTIKTIQNSDGLYVISILDQKYLIYNMYKRIIQWIRNVPITLSMLQ